MDKNNLIASNLCLFEGRIVRIASGKEPSWVTNSYGYKFCSIKNKTIYLHRAIWVLNFGPIQSKMEIDHIDRNPKNNDLSNLRLCGRSENNQNTKVRKDNTSGIKGVFWDKNSNSWRVSIWKNKKKHDGGRFKLLDDAKHAAYDIRVNAHGPFANHGEHIKDLNHAP